MAPLQKLAKLVGPRRFLRLMHLYPPYLGAGVRIRRVEPDLGQVEVEMRLTRWNRNFVGTHFGGSLYSMCDPFFMLMLMMRLGPDYVVWDKSASIDFIRPGRGTVRATFDVPDARLDEVRKEADGGDRVFPRFEVTITDLEGLPVARIEKTLYVRRKGIARAPAPT
jgi:acyl-coenzyme A thioesterase PaaI-like protein